MECVGCGYIGFNKGDTYYRCTINNEDYCNEACCLDDLHWKSIINQIPLGNISHDSCDYRDFLHEYNGKLYDNVDELLGIIGEFKKI